MLRLSVLAALAWLFAMPALAQAPATSVDQMVRATPRGSVEHITVFASDVVINKDGSLDVTETITVNVLGIDIQRGIIREFPTRYRDRNGDAVNVGFDVVSVTRDGKPEKFKLEDRGNGVDVRIGDRDVILPRGLHTYVIRYKTTWQMNFNDPEKDELYWNVTGNGWIFPIDSARATIRLPAGARPTDLILFTGPEGATTRNGVIAEGQPGVVEASTNAPLAAYEGLTIAVQFPKGFVDRPTAADNTLRWLRDNLSAFFGLGGLLATLGFLSWAWNKVGRDPDRGTIIPLFQPPEGLEPASARYLRNLSFDNRAFAATVLGMATKGVLKISEEEGWISNTYTLTRTGQGADKLSPGERSAYDALFTGGDTLVLKQENYRPVQAAVQALTGVMRSKHDGKDFHGNGGYVFAGAGIAVAFGVLAWFTGRADSLAIVLGIGTSVLALVAAIGSAFVMQAPTPQGQKLRDEIDGFRMFLDVAERERWQALNPPEMTPQLFEKYFPYALALGVEHTWSETFEREMRLKEPGSAYEYRPNWYSGRNFSGIGAGALASSLSNAMTNAISASSSPPGKSSGFGGGGFSGGGGGGGGGRGW